MNAKKAGLDPCPFCKEAYKLSLEGRLDSKTVGIVSVNCHECGAKGSEAPFVVNDGVFMMADVNRAMKKAQQNWNKRSK